MEDHSFYQGKCHVYDWSSSRWLRSSWWTFSIFRSDRSTRLFSVALSIDMDKMRKRSPSCPIIIIISMHRRNIDIPRRRESHQRWIYRSTRKKTNPTLRSLLVCKPRWTDSLTVALLDLFRFPIPGHPRYEQSFKKNCSIFIRYIYSWTLSLCTILRIIFFFFTRTFSLSHFSISPSVIHRIKSAVLYRCVFSRLQSRLEVDNTKNLIEMRQKKGISYMKTSFIAFVLCSHRYQGVGLHRPLSCGA